MATPTMPTFNPKWLLLLGVAGVSMVAFNDLFPGAGVAIAASVALFWVVNSGADKTVTGWVKTIRKGAAL